MKRALFSILTLIAFSSWGISQCATAVFSVSENFNSYSSSGPLPTCWIPQSGSGVLIQAGANPYAIMSTSTSETWYMVLPKTTNAQGVLTFTARSSQFVNPAPKLDIGVMTDPNNPATFTLIEASPYYQYATTYTRTVDLSSYVGAGQYVAFKSYPDASGPANYSFWIDNINYTSATGTGPKIYVDKDATGLNDGTSWANAFTDLQSALAIVTPSNNIWVADGTYKPHASNRAISFSIPTNISIYGGFNGTETSLTQRDPKINVTILSGDLAGNDHATLWDQAQPSRSDNSYHVVTLKGNIQSVVLDGFTITGGNANGGLDLNCATPRVNQYNHNRGAAIYHAPYNNADKTSVKLVNCVLEKNSGLTESVVGVMVPCGSTSAEYRTDAVNCIVRNNHSQTGAAFLVSGANGYGIFARGSIINSLFYNNTTVSGPSCLFLDANTGNGGTSAGLSFEIANSTFANNSGQNGNAIYMNNAGNSTLKNTIIYGNGSTTPLSLSGPSSVTTNSIIEGGQLGALNKDPKFKNVAANDFSLDCNSPALEKGLTVVSLPSYDLNGNQREFGVLDMGAFEYQAIHTVTPPDTIICAGSSITLNATGLTGISWTNGITNGISFIPTTTNTYTLTGADSLGCIVNKDIIVTLPSIQLSSSVDTIINGTSVTLTAPNATSVVWNNSVTEGVPFTPSTTKYYTATGTVSGCSVTDSIQVFVINIFDQPISVGTSVLCSGDSTTISINNSIIGANYFLRNANDIVVDGPFPGNGTTLQLNTKALFANDTFNVLAQGPKSSVINNSLEFDGVNEHIALGTSDRGVTNQLTIGTWVKTTDVQGCFTYKYSGSQGELFYIDGTGKIRIDGRDGTGGYKTSGPSINSVNDNQWHYVAATVNGTTGVWSVYIDGVLESSTTQVAGISMANGTALTMGVGTGYNLSGQLDEFTMYKRALSQSEIIDNMYGCLTGNETDLVAYFKFNEGTGNSILVDHSTFASNGTLTNMEPATDWKTGYNPACFDSIYQLEFSQKANISVNPTYNQTATVSICSGDSYTFPDNATQSNITSQVVHTSNLTTIANGCDSIIVTTVNINPIYNQTATVSVCSGDSYTFPDNTTQTNITSQVVHTSNLTTIANGCDSIIVTTVNPVIITTTLSLVGTTLTSQETGATYQWLDCNNGFAQINGETSQSYTASSNGTFAVEITKNSCVDTSVCEVVATTAITNAVNEEITIYPNPSQGNFMINIGSKDFINLMIIDYTGKTVYSDTLKDKLNNLELTYLANGVYQVLMFDSNKNSTQARLVINK